VDGVDNPDAVRLGVWFTDLDASKGMDMRLRKALYTDAQLLLDIHNEARLFFTKQSKLTYTEHFAWLKGNIDVQDINIVLANDVPIGYIRHDNYSLSYALKQRYRGYGYGKQMIRMYLQMHQDQAFRAEIKPDNVASVNTVISLGFRYVGSENDLLIFTRPSDKLI
jgi:RimJ/RimL family protein N-acetyltransferase